MLNPFRFSRLSQVAVVGLLGILIALAVWTQCYGLKAVDDLERSEFGYIYMKMRTNPPSSVLPLFITTGFTAGVYDTRTGKEWCEPISRRYYLWIGKPFRIAEWHRPKDGC